MQGSKSCCFVLRHLFILFLVSFWYLKFALRNVLPIVDTLAGLDKLARLLGMASSASLIKRCTIALSQELGFLAEGQKELNMSKSRIPGHGVIPVTGARDCCRLCSLEAGAVIVPWSLNSPLPSHRAGTEVNTSWLLQFTIQLWLIETLMKSPGISLG